MEINQDLVVNATAIFGTIGGILFGLQKALKAWSTDRGDIQKIGIDSDLYTRLNLELTRLSATNEAQAEEITELRDKCSKISEEFAAFRLDSVTKDIAMLDLKRQLLECTNKVFAMQTVNNTKES